jgi:outer membrane protein assembly factor BamB
MTFRRVAEIPLPGPLRDEPLRLDDGTVRLPVNGGWAIVTLEPEPSVRISTTAPPGPDTGDENGPEWVVSDDGRFRFRAEAAGKVIAERNRRKGWRKAWRRRIAGATLAPPLVSGRRLYLGSMDNQVYALRADNGHYLWAKDVGARISRPLTWWQGRVGEGPTFVELVLVVLDNGGSILALDPYDGSRLASLDLPTEEDRLLPPALVAGDGKIVVAVQKYEAAEAALLVFELAPPAPADNVAYNVPDLSEEGDPD